MSKPLHMAPRPASNRSTNAGPSRVITGGRVSWMVTARVQSVRPVSRSCRHLHVSPGSQVHSLRPLVALTAHVRDEQYWTVKLPKAHNLDTASDYKPQSAPDKPGDRTEHGARRVSGGTEWMNV